MENKNQNSEYLIPIGNPLLVSILFVALYGVLNSVINLKFPGVTQASLRPQILFIFLAGYFYGPVYGFLTGFLGNIFGDWLLGLGFEYIWSFSTANGIYGMLMGFFVKRKEILSTIKDFSYFISYLILVNIAGMTYAVIFISITGKESIWEWINLFILPILLSNIWISLILVPLSLLMIRRIVIKFGTRLHLLLYYFTILSVFITGMVIFSQIEIEYVTRSKALIDMFVSLFIPIIILTVIGIYVSQYIVNQSVQPIQVIHETLKSFGKSEYDNNKILKISERPDEIGDLAKSIYDLGKKLRDKEKRMIRVITNNYGFDLDEILTFQGFYSALNKISEEKISKDKKIKNNMEAISYFVKAGGLSELAESYSSDKLEPFLQKMNLSDDEKKELQLILDMNIMTQYELQSLHFYGSSNPELLKKLLFQLILIKGENKNYIGDVEDDNIFQMVTSNWAFDRFPKTFRFLPTAHSISLTAYETNFNKEYSLIYCHNELKHIKQLIGLLKTKKITAKIQMIPKYAVFPYLNTWDFDANMLEVIQKIDDKRILVRRKEFDLEFEFYTLDDKRLFREILEKYTKKEFSKSGFLYGSWYEPLIVTFSPDDNGKKAYRVSQKDSEFIYSSYSILPNSRFFQDIPGKTLIEEVWVTEGFYQYLKN